MIEAMIKVCLPPARLDSPPHRDAAVSPPHLDYQRV
jgi:hypothetical protein